MSDRPIDIRDITEEGPFRVNGIPVPTGPRRGRLSNYYTVWCADGPECSHVDGKTEAEAAQDAIKRGWAYTKARGWLCPACVAEAARTREARAARKAVTPDQGSTDPDR